MHFFAKIMKFCSVGRIKSQWNGEVFVMLCVCVVFFVVARPSKMHHNKGKTTTQISTASEKLETTINSKKSTNVIENVERGRVSGGESATP